MCPGSTPRARAWDVGRILCVSTGTTTPSVERIGVGREQSWRPQGDPQSDAPGPLGLS